jgi:rare lipoprotein A (peptidoglycan hydrolase)
MRINKWGFPQREEIDFIKEGTCACLKAVALMLVWLFILLCLTVRANAETVSLKASWYSDASLKQEGTWKTSKGIMANGKQFDETKLTCATRLYPLGARLRVLNVRNGKTVIVTCTDRIGKRFAKTRIDLSKAAFEKIAMLKEGLISVEVSQ